MPDYNKLSTIMKGSSHLEPLAVSAYGINTDDKALTPDTDITNRIINAQNAVPKTIEDYGITSQEFEEFNERGADIKPYMTTEEKNKALADSQGMGEQVINMLVQAGAGEAVLGTFEGFGNIYDGFKSLFTDDFTESEYTKYFREARENLEDNFKIYQKDPNATFAFNDFGWIAQGLVSSASTISLMLPAIGVAKGASLIGNIVGKGVKAIGDVTKLSKPVNKLTRASNRGLVKAVTHADKSMSKIERYNALKDTEVRLGKIGKTIDGFKDISFQAFLSRTGENYMEGRQVYNSNYETVLTQLNNMSKEEFTNFINEHPEFITKDENGNNVIPSKDDIAKSIATKSAKDTMFADYWMLGMDVAQLKALGSIWGKTFTRANTASEKLEFQNLKRIWQGKTDKELIKNNFWNRTKLSAKEVVKHPFNSLEALELGEGFEEMFQGIQSNKGEEQVNRYFDKNFKPKDYVDYLTDPTIWEQFLWGSIGAIVFNKSYKGVQKGKHLAEGVYKKHTLTNEQYEAWKKSEEKISENNIKNVNARIATFINEINAINNGENPFDFVLDANGNRLIKNGDYVHTLLTEEEKEMYKRKALDKLITQMAFEHIDGNTIDLLKEAIHGDYFDQYMQGKGVNMKADKKLSDEIYTRLGEVENVYYNELRNVNSKTNPENPYVGILLARTIAERKLDIQDYDKSIAEIDSLLATMDGTDEDYFNNQLYEVIEDIEKQIQEKIDEINNDKKLSESAKKMYVLDLKRKLEYYKKYKPTTYTGINENYTPVDSVEELYDKKIRTILHKAYTEHYIPINNKEYEEQYEKYSLGMERHKNDAIDNAIERFKKYIANAEDVDKAFEEFLNPKTKELKELSDLLQYGYKDDTYDNYNKVKHLNDLQIFSIVEEEKQKRQTGNNATNTNTSTNNTTTNNNVNNVNDNNGTNTNTNTNNTSTSQTTSTNQTTNNGTTTNINNEQIDINNTVDEIDKLTNEIINNENLTEDEKQHYIDRLINMAREYEFGEDNDRPINNDNNKIVAQKHKVEIANIRADIEDFIKNKKENANDRSEIKSPEFNDFFNRYDRIKQTIKESKLGKAVKDDLLKQLESIVNELERDNDGKIIDNDSNKAKLDNINNKLKILADTINNKISEQLLIDDFRDVEGNETVVTKTEDSGVAPSKEEEIFDEMIGEIFDTITKDGSILNDSDKLEDIIKEKFKDKIPADVIDKVYKQALVNVLFSMQAFNDVNTPALKLAIAKLLSSVNETYKKANTNLITNEEADKELEKILDEFIKKHNIGEDNNIVNLKDLFKSIIDDINLNAEQSIALYNKIIDYVIKHNGEKYTFTGFINNGTIYTGEDFYNDVLIAKNEHIVDTNDDGMHINFLEPEKRTKDFYVAVNSLQNGSKLFARLERGENNTEPYISIYVKVRQASGHTKYIKIGILRTVDANKNGTMFNPIKHYSGFGFNIDSVENDIPVMPNLDAYFETIIKNLNNDASVNELVKILLDYYIKINNYRRNVANGSIKEDARILNSFLTKETADKFINNPLVQQLLKSGEYKFYTKKTDSVTQAKELINQTINILFHDSYDEINRLDVVNIENNDFSINSATMLNNYLNFKKEVLQNYRYTYELQKHLPDENAETVLNLFIPIVVTENIIAENKPMNGIAKLHFNPVKENNTRQYTPLVFVKNGKLQDEMGNILKTYSDRELEHMKDGLIGYLIYDDKQGNVVVSWCYNDNNTYIRNNTELYNNIKLEIVDIIKNHLNNFTSFEETRLKITSLFNYTGVFTNDRLYIIQQDNFFIIKKDGRDYIKFNKQDKYKSSITIYNEDGSNVVITNLDNADNRKLLSNQFISLINNFRFNKSINTIQNKPDVLIRYDKGVPQYVRNYYYSNDVNGFKLNIGNYKLHVNNYGEFLIVTNAFSTRTFYNPKTPGNPYITKSPIINKAVLNFNIVETSPDIVNPNNPVYELFFPTEELTSNSRKTIFTRDILRAANINNYYISLLLGESTGIPLVPNALITDKDATDYKLKYVVGKGTYISPNGANDFANPHNMVRLLVHERIHQRFNELSKSKKEKVIKEILGVYKYTKDKLEADYKNKVINEKLYNSIKNVFDIIDSYGKDATITEEFIAEALSQKELMNYLNRTDYLEEVIIDNEEQHKTLFQKIIEILLRLFNESNDVKIKNNTILAKTYTIFGDDRRSSTKNKSSNQLNLFDDSNGNDTSNTNANKNDSKDSNRQDNTENDHTTLPVEGNDNKTATQTNDRNDAPNIKLLNDTEQQVNQIEDDFNSLITRSENFSEDHTYFLNGEKVDTSVTELIHGGKTEIAKEFGIPASALGNTLDGVGRDYFVTGEVSEDTPNLFPNIEGFDKDGTTNGLKRDFDIIKEYLDKKFGKDRYKVITKEFPIGAYVTVNDKRQSIAGTMDMLVITDKGELYIYDFKTTRSKMDANKIQGYSNQVNVYRRILQANYPNLKVKIGGLVVFSVSYTPNANYEINENGNITLNGKLIQDADPEFTGITLFDKENPIIELKEDDSFQATFEKLDKPKPKPNNENNNTNNETENTNDNEDINNDLDEDNDIYDEDYENNDLYNDDYENDLDDNNDRTRFAKTDMIESDNSIDIYTESMDNNPFINSSQIVKVNNMNDFVNRFDAPIQSSMASMVNSDELNYSCQ